MIGPSLFFSIIVMIIPPPKFVVSLNSYSGGEWTEEQISSVKTIFEDYYFINGQIYYFVGWTRELNSSDWKSLSSRKKTRISPPTNPPYQENVTNRNEDMSLD